MSRKEPSLRDKLAAAVRELLGIPFEHARLMTAEQMLSLVQWDHILYHSQNKHEPWVDEHWNLQPLTIRGDHGHAVKTQADLRQIGKTRRISKEHEDFTRRLLTPRAERPAKKSRWGSRPFPKRQPR